MLADGVTEKIQKANRCLYYVRVLGKLHVKPNIIALFYNSTVCPMLNYGMVAIRQSVYKMRWKNQEGSVSE